MKALFVVIIVIFCTNQCNCDDFKEPDLLYEDMFNCLKEKYSSSIYDLRFRASVLPGDMFYKNIVAELSQTQDCYEYSIIRDYLKAVKFASRRYSNQYTQPIHSEALEQAYTAAYGNVRGSPSDLAEYFEYIEKNYYTYSNDDNVTPLTDDILTIVYIQLYKLAVVGGNYKPITGDRKKYNP